MSINNALTPTQKKAQMQLNRYLEYDKNTLIKFVGKQNSGKKTIIKNLIENSSTGYKSYILLGENQCSFPYSAWSKFIKYSKNKFRWIINEIGTSIGINIHFLSFSVEFSGERNNKNNREEIRIIKSIKRIIGNKKSIVVCDNFELWDDYSKQVLYKIINQKSESFIKNTKFLILLKDDKGETESFNNYCKVVIDDFSKEDFIFFNAKVSPETIKTLISLNIQDINIIKMIVQNPNKDLHYTTIEDIIKDKLIGLGSNKHDIISLLEAVSIVDYSFSLVLASFLSQLDEDTCIGAIRECIDIKIIEGRELYNFISNTFRTYFKEELSIKELELHKRFSQFLKEKTPEEYLSRALQLFLGDSNNSSSLIESFSLCIINQIKFLEYGNTYNNKSTELEQCILNKISEITPSLANELINFKKRLLEGIKYIKNTDYLKAYDILFPLEHFLKMHTKLLLTEYYRILLIAQTQHLKNLDNYYENTEKLYNLIIDDKFNEYDMFCKSALLLIPIYSDKVSNITKRDQLVDKIRKVISKNPREPYIAYSHELNKKSVAFLSNKVSKESLISCKNYYSQNSDEYNLYICLSNLSGVFIGLGEYEDSIKVADMILSNLDNNITYPSLYKIKNNKILAQYLQIEKEYVYKSISKEVYNKKVVKYLKEFKNLDNSLNQKDTSLIIKFNIIGLLFILGEINEINNILKEMEDKVFKSKDEFYKYYYYYNSRLLVAIITRNEPNIKTFYSAIIKIIDNGDSPILDNNKAIIKERHCIIESFKKQNIKNYENTSFFDYYFKFNPYNEQIGTRRNDEWKFWGRLILFSDLQILSL